MPVSDSLSPDSGVDVPVSAESAYRLDQTWLAYAFDRSVDPDRVEAGLQRVGAHYAATVDCPLSRRGGGGTRGVVVWDPAKSACFWPMWSSGNDVEVGTAYVPTGWRRIADVSAEVAPIALGRALRDDPARASDLDAPLAMGVLDRAAESLTLVNDVIGLARLYEMRFDDGWVWSNRLGALPLFAGVVPRPSEEGWELLAASGWFMGGTTAIHGASKLPGGSIIVCDRNGVRRTRSDALGNILRPRETRIRDLVDGIAEQAIGLVEAVARAWAGPLRIELTGGRDSRVNAAAAIAGGVSEPVFITRDLIRGEAEFAHDLLEKAPGDHRQVVRAPTDVLEPDIFERALRSHLVHDAMRSPECLHEPHPLRNPSTSQPVLSGHGGETAHGFFYARPQLHRKIRQLGSEGPRWRLGQFFRPHVTGVVPAASDRLEGQIDASLTEGRKLGLDEVVLLDHFYLTERLANWADLPAGTGRHSVFLTPAFLEAAFDLTPRQRLRDALHRRVTSRLLPEWDGLPYFDPSGSPGRVKPHLWQRPNDAAAMEHLLADDASWGELFDSAKVREMWSNAKREGGTMLQEKTFERIMFRASFEEHLKLLARAAC